MHAEAARKHAAHDPLALLLHAQSAQLDGDREGAQRAFRAMAEREDTRLLGLRGLFIEAQRADDPVAAVMVAEEALKLSPSSSWASHAVLGFCCAKGDWAGALKILDNNQSAGLIDKATYRRQRGVLLTARALELEKVDRDLSRESVMEAVKLAPTLVPAAVLASKFESEAHQIRRSMRLVEAAWLAQPHPDLADAYAHVKLGDSARQRLVRVETLSAKMPGHIEGALAIARAAIDASEFTKAREALAPFIAAPTQRVALLMAEIERTEHGDSRPGPRTAMLAIAGGRSRPSPGGWMPSSGRRRLRHCRPTRVARSNPQPSRKPCWRTRTAPSCSSRQRTSRPRNRLHHPPSRCRPTRPVSQRLRRPPSRTMRRLLRPRLFSPRPLLRSPFPPQRRLRPPRRPNRPRAGRPPCSGPGRTFRRLYRPRFRQSFR
jgi:hypothetical protein